MQIGEVPLVFSEITKISLLYRQGCLMEIGFNFDAGRWRLIKIVYFID